MVRSIAGCTTVVRRCAYRCFLAVKPGDARLWFLYGNFERAEGNPSAADAASRRAFAIDPEIKDLRRVWARQLIRAGQLDDALLALQPALGRADQGWALSMAAQIYRLKCRPDDGRAVLARATGRIAEDPSILAEQARLYSEDGRFDLALDWFERAQRADGSPDAFWEERYWALLALKRLGDAFPLMRFRTRKARLRLPEHVSLWAPGDKLSEAPLVLAEQGLGDEIKFATCYPDLLKNAPAAVITTHRKLHRLMQRSFPDTRIVPVERFLPEQKRAASLLDGQGKQELARTRQCVVAADLVAHYRPSLASFASRAPMLKADADLKNKWRRRLEELGPGAKIGLSWTSIGKDPERLPRYAQLAAWLPLLATPGVHFINLQHGADPADLARARSRGTPLAAWDDFDPTTDLDGLAALMTELDLVISAHSMTKELAGAVGARTWLVYHLADPQLLWRRRDDGSDLWFGSIEHVVAGVPTSAEQAIAQVKERLERAFG
jgi:tetratricopeptide (TPR) repeat protein